MEPQAFDLLLHLVRHREQVVSRDEIMEQIWDGRIVSESALSTRINTVRKAIGDSGNEQRLIKTLPRKGVRFVGEVREGRDASEAPDAVDAPRANDANGRLPAPQPPGAGALDGHLQTFAAAVRASG